MMTKFGVSRAVLASVVLLLSNGALSQWVNDLDEVLDFNCPLGETISRVQSIHDNDSEDRMWAFECKPMPMDVADLICLNTGFVNDFDEDISHVCPFNGLWSGVHSEHSNSAEDRRWDFKCCGAPGYLPTNCYFTPDLNEFDGPMDFTVDDGYFVHGFHSHNSNAQEDRRWKLMVCQMINCGAADLV